MTKLFSSLFLILTISFATLADGYWKRVNMEYRGQKSDTRYPVFNKFTVCDLKIAASKAFKLNPYRFNVHLDGQPLPENRSLSALGFRHNIMVQIVKVKSSSQCAGQFPGFKE